MDEQNEKRLPGRPVIYTQDRKQVTMFFPAEVLRAIDRVANNRTRWLVEAAREKLAREHGQT